MLLVIHCASPVKEKVNICRQEPRLFLLLKMSSTILLCLQQIHGIKSLREIVCETENTILLLLTTPKRALWSLMIWAGLIGTLQLQISSLLVSLEGRNNKKTKEQSIQETMHTGQIDVAMQKIFFQFNFFTVFWSTTTNFSAY